MGKMEIKKDLKYCDILIWISFGMMLLVKLITLTLFSYFTTTTGTDITAVATNFEANPLFKLFLNFQMIGYILGTIIVPASAMAVYYLIRRKVKNGKVDLQTLTFFVQFAFFSLLINIVNDGATLIGKFI